MTEQERARRAKIAAVTATIRTQLITVAARVTRSARRATLRLPTLWPWATAWQRLFTTAIGTNHDLTPQPPPRAP